MHLTIFHVWLTVCTVLHTQWRDAVSFSAVKHVSDAPNLVLCSCEHKNLPQVCLIYYMVLDITVISVILTQIQGTTEAISAVKDPGALFK